MGWGVVVRGWLEVGKGGKMGTSVIVPTIKIKLKNFRNEGGIESV